MNNDVNPLACFVSAITIDPASHWEQREHHQAATEQRRRDQGDGGCDSPPRRNISLVSIVSLECNDIQGYINNNNKKPNESNKCTLPNRGVEQQKRAPSEAHVDAAAEGVGGFGGGRGDAGRPY